jgi:hypothetical protein
MGPGEHSSRGGRGPGGREEGKSHYVLRKKEEEICKPAL